MLNRTSKYIQKLLPEGTHSNKSLKTWGNVLPSLGYLQDIYYYSLSLVIDIEQGLQGTHSVMMHSIYNRGSPYQQKSLTSLKNGESFYLVFFSLSG